MANGLTPVGEVAGTMVGKTGILVRRPWVEALVDMVEALVDTGFHSLGAFVRGEALREGPNFLPVALVQAVGQAAAQTLLRVIHC